MSKKTNIVNTFSNIPVSSTVTRVNEDGSAKEESEQRVTLSSSASVDSPLLYASKDIFKETYRLMNTEESLSLVPTSRLMEKHLKSFSNLAMEQGVSAVHLKIARYLLSTFIDEMLSSRNWGDEGDWGSVSLLGKYFEKSDGGETFFILLQQFEKEPTEYIFLMELAYVCLSFGYGGKYKKRGQNIHDLGPIKENLYRQIKTTKPKKEKFYANHPAAQRHHKLYSKLSKKIILLVSTLLLVVIYAIFTYTVQNNESSLIETLKSENSKMREANHAPKSSEN